MPLVRCTGSSTGKVSLETAADPPPPRTLVSLEMVADPPHTSCKLGDSAWQTTHLCVNLKAVAEPPHLQAATLWHRRCSQAAK